MRISATATNAVPKKDIEMTCCLSCNNGHCSGDCKAAQEARREIKASAARRRAALKRSIAAKKAKAKSKLQSNAKKKRVREA